MQSIEELIEKSAHDMFNPELNFNIAQKYEEVGQTASAISFYLRAAEYGHDTHHLIVYTSMLKIAHCFQDQSGREHSVQNALLQAIQYLPSRPEAYFLLARFYERSKDWQHCYTFSEIGLMCPNKQPMLPADVEYYGDYCLLFEKATSGWWVGRRDESLSIFLDLLKRNLPQEYIDVIKWNIKAINPDVIV